MSEIGSDGILTKISSLNFGIQGFFDDECEWIDPDGRVQMSDTRRFRIVFFDKARYGIYVTINWYAVDDVQITANRNCLFGVQASAPLAPTGGGPHGREDEVMPPNKLFSALTTSNREPTLSGAKPHGQKDEVMPPNKLGSKIPTSNREPTLSGAKPHGQKDEVMPPKKLGSKIPTSNREPTLSGGTMMNSNGDYGSQAIYGRRANWVTCWGQLHAANPAAAPDDNLYLQEGVALMSHPSNPWGVSPWNTTPFGYMSPTHIPFLSKPWSLRAGEGVRLRYMILAYTGDPAGAEIDELYRSYSNS